MRKNNDPPTLLVRGKTLRDKKYYGTWNEAFRTRLQKNLYGISVILTEAYDAGEILSIWETLI